MDAKHIKELMAKLGIFYTVYEIMPHEIPGALNGHILNRIDDFETEEEAVNFIIENHTSYHSLTIIKRYE